MDERIMEESKGLVEKITEVIGKLELPPGATKGQIDSIDLEGNTAIKKEDYQNGMIGKARAAAAYFGYGFYYHAANSADRAANASYRLKVNVQSRQGGLSMMERVLVSTEAYLSELAGNCYLEIGEKENAVFAYLKAAKGYVYDFSDVKKAEELLARAMALDEDGNIMRKNRFANKIYDKVILKMKSIKPLSKS